MIRPLALGALIGAALAMLSSSCGNTAPRCLISNCSGCCDEQGICQPGTEPQACGKAAASCATCASIARCASGLCRTSDGGIAVVTDGGSSPRTDAGCGAGTCNGCCDNGRCVPGNLYSSCGGGGRVCLACPGGETCIDSFCQSFTCPGCVASDGGCQGGTVPLACGTDGGVCRSCPTGQSCFAGQCVSATTCGPANCGGCCDGTTCVKSTTDALCGNGGDLCKACQPPKTCANGSCGTGGTGGGTGGTGGGSGGGGGGTSNASCFLTCNGCCLDGVCMAGTATNACGVYGFDCATDCTLCLAGFCIKY